MLTRLVRRDDQGHATIILLTGLMFSLLAIMMLFLRLGSANDLRSKAQTAADAAALAAVNDTQARLASALGDGQLMEFASWEEESGKAAAEGYATKNKGVVKDVRASDNAYGFTGNHVRVEVRGAQCQRELDEDRERKAADAPCRGDEKEKKIDTFAGEAAAIARIDMPNCTMAEISENVFLPQCDGLIIRNESDARSVIDVKLVDDEGKYLFDPSATGDNSDLVGNQNTEPCDAPKTGGNITPLMCATHKEILKKFPNFKKPGDGGGCLAERSGSSEHPKGRACDYMTSDKEFGDSVSQYIQDNADKLGIMYIIWRQRIWKPGQGWESMEDRGGATQNHYDHVHVSVK